MKKIVILFAIVLFTGMMTESFAGKNRTLSTGFSMNYTIGQPSINYGFGSNDFGSNDIVLDANKIGLINGFEIGTRWYISPGENLGLGIMVNWFDVSFGVNSNSTMTRNVFDMSFFELGPIATLALSTSIAIDAYYNFRPTMFLSSYTTYGTTTDYDNAYLGFGASHAVGTALRWKVLSFGVEYVYGTINCLSTDIDNDYTRLLVNNFRVKLGIKF